MKGFEIESNKKRRRYATAFFVNFWYNYTMSFDPEKVTFFARTDARGKNVPFGIKAKDRQRHVYVIGKTGMGKSTMLENMAV